jgi:hypothetical protein
MFKQRVLQNKYVPGRDEVGGGWRQLQMRNSSDTSNTLRGDQMEEEMGVACSMYGREKKCLQVSGGET